MNNQTDRSTYAAAGLEALQARFALRVAARLTEQTANFPQDLSERLRFARAQALTHARAARGAQTVVGVGSALALAGAKRGRWIPLASLLPLIVLVGGLMLIQRLHNNRQISAAAEIDATLLSDDLPPAAYSDPGFVEFLKVPHD